jgi:hypothetical protein
MSETAEPVQILLPSGLLSRMDSWLAMAGMRLYRVPVKGDLPTYLIGVDVAAYTDPAPDGRVASHHRGRGVRRGGHTPGRGPTRDKQVEAEAKESRHGLTTSAPGRTDRPGHPSRTTTMTWTASWHASPAPAGRYGKEEDCGSGGLVASRRSCFGDLDRPRRAITRDARRSGPRRR